MSRGLAAAAFAAGALPLALFAWRFDFVCDDAYISFRYARHLAEGLGLRFNPGVEPPVEGYTNLLWTLWAAIPHALGIDPAAFVRVTSVGLAFATLALVVRVAGAGSDRSGRAAVGAALFLGLQPAFGVWATSGLETMAFTAALFAGFAALRAPGRPPRSGWAAAAFVAAVLLRADGVVAVSAVLAGVALTKRELRGPAVRVGAMVALAVAGQFAFRLVVHEAWLPNTAAAKVELASPVAWKRGTLYVAHFLALFPAVLLAPLFTRPRGVALAAALPFAAVLLWSLAVGGDYMAFGRFLVPALPFAAVLAGGVFAGGSRVRGGVLAIAIGAGVAPAFGTGVLPESALARLNFRLGQDYESELEAWQGHVKGAERGLRVGRALAGVARPGDSLVAGMVGAQAYESRLFVHDRMGLVTRAVATREVERKAKAAGHDKGVSADFFLPLRPTIVHVLMAGPGKRRPLVVPAVFAQEYVAREFPQEDGSTLQLVVRADSHLAGAQGARSTRR